MIDEHFLTFFLLVDHRMIPPKGEEDLNSIQTILLLLRLLFLGKLLLHFQHQFLIKWKKNMLAIIETFENIFFKFLKHYKIIKIYDIFKGNNKKMFMAKVYCKIQKCLIETKSAIFKPGIFGQSKFEFSLMLMGNLPHSYSMTFPFWWSGPCGPRNGASTQKFFYQANPPWGASLVCLTSQFSIQTPSFGGVDLRASGRGGPQIIKFYHANPTWEPSLFAWLLSILNASIPF